jgi:hypothetical protein
MFHKCLRVLAAAIGLLAVSAIPVPAHTLNISGSSTCSPCQYTITVSGTSTPGASITVTYTAFFTAQSTGVTTSVTHNISATVGADGTYSKTVANNPSPVNCGADTYTISAQGTLFVNGAEDTTASFGPATLTCSTQPPPNCATGAQALSYNVSEQSKNASEIVWFNSHFKLQGNVPTTDFTVNVTNQSITFGSPTLAVPDAVITFTSTVGCASTSFNTTANQWETFIPLSYATHADEIFSAGLAYELPPSFPENVNNVTWNVTFTSSAPSLQFQFQYGAANYLSSNSKGDVFPTTASGQPDYNAMMIDPVHNAPTCNGYNDGDHAGTPENATVKSLVTGGGSGGGGSNWTGSWSSTPTYVCAAP